MASKRKKQNSRNCAVVNGVNMNNGSKKSKNDAKKKQQFMNEDDYRLRLQEIMFSPDYILEKIFRKDGPPLGDEFDSLPSRAFRCREEDYGKYPHTCRENQRASKRQKVSRLASDNQGAGDKGSPMKKHGIGKGLMTYNGSVPKKHGIGKGLLTREGAPVKKHGIGKGLMTVWRILNPDGRGFPISMTASRSKLLGVQEKRKRLQQRQTLLSKLRKKSQEKRKSSIRNRKVGTQKIGSQTTPQREKCELSIQGLRSQNDLNQFMNLIDDEELELRELQAGPNPVTCSAHLATNGLHSCSLCKDLLGKFPPDSVSMKLPLYMPPWGSSPELVKKLFKVFHFLSTYAMIINISPFTLDDFAQAFHDKDSSLLGQVHMGLLGLLMSDVEKELSSQYLTHASKNSKFLELVRLIERQKFVLESWQRSLNALTWTEILRQVLVAAGFGSKLGTLRRDALNKEANLMANFGLSPGTLKGELFSILLNQGSNGMKVSELINLPSITELNVAATMHELECLVSSTLSSDITLFEKISSCGYRLRANPATKEPEVSLSDSEDFGSVDDDSDMNLEHISSDESGELGGCDSNKHSQSKTCEDKCTTLVLHTEIDESHPGEAWLLGLFEGEYADLSIEEKLSALFALIDLLSSGYSIRLEDPVAAVSTFTSSISQQGSGAKIKRSMVKQYLFPGQAGSCNGLVVNNKDTSLTSDLNPADSFVPLSKMFTREKFSSTREAAKDKKAVEDLHPMQSIFLGSDRRYNRYWLFLGPCNDLDPGHKRIYFESSEDGHWEVIEKEEALCSLISALDRRGTREAFLLSSLEKRESYLCRMMSNMSNNSGTRRLTHSDQSEQNMSREDSSSAVSDVDSNLHLIEMQNDLASTDARISEINRKAEQQKDKWNRSQAFDSWVWESFYSQLNAVKHGKRSYLDSLTRCERCHDLYWRDEKHCKVCHTTFELDFDLEEKYAIHAATCRRDIDSNKIPKHKVLSSQLQSLKAAVHAIESVMPEEFLMGAWAKSTHNLWVKRLRRASTLTEFVQVIADFVSAINEEYFYQFDHSLGSNWVIEEILASFPTMPQTSSAIALWLVKLDALVAPHLRRVQSQDNLQIIRRIEGQPAPL